MTAETLQASQLKHRDYVAAVEDYYRRGWTDGLPVIPPEPARVAAFLDAGGVTAREVVGAVPTRDVIVTAEDVAINAVMAGCLPEYASVALTAVRALLHDEAIPHSVTATLGSAAQLIIVNGPMREQIGVECGQGCMGPGFRANATIGRALRLVVRNVLRTIPHELDRGVFSTPNRYSFCLTSWKWILPSPSKKPATYDASNAFICWPSLGIALNHVRGGSGFHRYEPVSTQGLLPGDAVCSTF